MAGLMHDGNCCKSFWDRWLMVIAGISLRRPDKTGHFRTLGGEAVTVSRGGRGNTGRFTPGRSLRHAPNGGRYSLVKELLARPQRLVREDEKT